MRTLRVVMILVSALMVFSGCDENRLSIDQQAAVAGVRAAFSATCLDGSRYGQTLRGADRLISIYREDPEAIYQPGGKGPKLTMRQVLQDAASRLDDCDLDQARELDRALDAEP